MLTEDLIEDLTQLNRNLMSLLWQMADSRTVPPPQAPRLIFPVLRNGMRRISEQEARALFCDLLRQQTKYYYAVETPTTQKYMQSGMLELSARTDLALFRVHGSELACVANIEFKAKNPTLANFTKDIEKLIREKVTGNWFHLLDNENKGTLPSVFQKFTRAFEANQLYVGHDIDILFSVCVLQTGRAFLKRMQYKHGGSDYIPFIHDFFSSLNSWQAVSLENLRNL